MRTAALGVLVAASLAGCASRRGGLPDGSWGPALPNSLECARDVMTSLGYEAETFPSRRTVEGVVLLDSRAELAPMRLVLSARLVQGREGTILVVRSARRLESIDPRERERYTRRPRTSLNRAANELGDGEAVLASCTRR